MEDRTPVGFHLLVDFWGCRYDESPSFWDRLIRDAVDRVGATLLDLHVEPFSPNGLTAFALLSESHLAVHTWPERDYVAIDIFTCGDPVRLEAGVECLRSALRPARESITRASRGLRQEAIESPDALEPASPGETLA